MILSSSSTLLTMPFFSKYRYLSSSSFYDSSTGERSEVLMMEKGDVQLNFNYKRNDGCILRILSKLTLNVNLLIIVCQIWIAPIDTYV